MSEIELKEDTWLVLSPQELKQVVEALMDRPYRVSNPVINSIIKQLQNNKKKVDE